MNCKDYAIMIERQMQATRDAQGLKGQKAKNKPSRRVLELMFMEKVPSQSVGAGTTMRTCFIGFAYPPSIISLCDLKHIDISTFRLETHHIGKVLVVRTFGHPTRIQAVQNAVEDAYGGVDRLAVYNEDPAFTPGQVLPKGAIFAIKEPFYKSTADGGYTIRVDHPSDLVRLDPADPFVPRPFRTASTSAVMRKLTQWKLLGNDLYRKKDYLEALNMYSRGIKAIEQTQTKNLTTMTVEAQVSALTLDSPVDSADVESDTLRRDLHRNRALVHLNLFRYEAALADALASSIPTPDEEGKKQNTKAQYRAGRAAYELGEFEQAAEYFHKALKTVHDDADSLRELDRTLRRLYESTTGKYDFAQICASVNESHKRLDHANYTKNVVIRESPGRGRGLFCTKDIKAGDLVLIEKAFNVAFASDSTTDCYTIINLNTRRGQMGPQASLLFRIIQKLRHHPKQALKFLDLYDGDYKPKCESPTIDGETVIDTFQTQAIIEHNVFGCSETKTSDDLRNPDINTSDIISSADGIWLTASYANHACDGNVRRTFIGDLMVVRASKDIAEAEEIFMPYRSAESDYEQTVFKLQQTWGFACDCTICTSEAKTTAKQREDRKQLFGQVKDLMIRHRQTQEYLPSKSVIAKVEQLYRKLEETYCGDALSKSTKSAAHKPSMAPVEITARPGLHDVAHWLAQAYSTPSTPQKGLDWAFAMLRDMGYAVQIKKAKVIIDRQNACAMPATIDGAVYAAHIYFFRGQNVIGKQFMEFAMENYRTFFGEMEGFEEKYGTTHKQFM